MKRLLVPFIMCLFYVTMTAQGRAVAGECDEVPGITVTGSSSGEYAPDAAAINISVETTAKTASEAVESNAREAEAVIKEMKKLLGPEDTVKTSSYTVRPVYEKSFRERPRAYRATNTVTVRTKRTGDVGRIIDRAVESGSNSIGGVRFELEDYSGKCDLLLDEASKKAISAARRTAQSFGAVLDGPQNIRHSCSASARPVFAEAYTMAKEAAPTPIEAGTIKVQAMVEATFRIKK